MKNILTSVTCVVFFCATVSATISTNVNIKSSSSRLDSSMSFVSINNFNIDSILRYDNYEDVGGTIINSGLSKETLVVRFTITNNLGNDRIYIKVPTVIVDSITLFDVTNNAYVLSGASIPREERVYDDPYCVFPININRGSSSEFLLVVSTQFPFVSPIEIRSAEDLTSEIGFRNLYLGLFSGVMLLMFAYNFILLVLTKDRNYFYYIGYIFFIFIAQANFLGFSYYLFGNFPLFNNSLFYIGSGVSGIFGCLFLRNFLFTKTNVPVLDKGLSIIMLLYIVQILVTLFGNYFFSTILIQAIGALVVIVFGIIAIYLTIKKIPYARFYLIAWTPLLIGLITLILRDNGLLPYNNITTYLFSVGILLETVLLSLALADQINTLKKDNEMTHLRVVQEIEKNKELVLNQNVTLELKVTERTAALQQALDDLKSTQSQLVQSEKMASLGTLTAGIAHEINNPINFVSANVIPLRENINDITKLIAAYKSIDYSNLKSELKRLAGLEEELELDYMLTETKQLIDGIDEGAKRTHTIVEGLTSFSRRDMVEKSEADINRGIRSTLSVLKSRLNNVKLITNLDKNLPLVSCQVGKINQVVLNLINNALDALEEKNGTNRKASELTVETVGLGDSVKIIISDNGNGIDIELQRKIMEPFFTTKEVGKGTGLGLSISYSIIEDHGGAIDIVSEMGVGTRFTVTLPVVS